MNISPCPFCGSPDKDSWPSAEFEDLRFIPEKGKKIKDRGFEILYRVTCRKCGAQGGSSRCPDYEDRVEAKSQLTKGEIEAIEIWNQRSPV